MTTKTRETLNLILGYIFVLIARIFPINHKFYMPYMVPAGIHGAYAFPVFVPEEFVWFRFKTNKTWDWPWRNKDDDDLSKVVGVYWQDVHTTSVRLVVRRRKNGLYEFWYYIYDRHSGPQSGWGRDHHLKGKMFETKKLEKEYTVGTGLRNGKFTVSITWDGIPGYITKELKTDFRPFLPTGIAFPYAGGNNTFDKKWIVPLKFEKWGYKSY